MQLHKYGKKYYYFNIRIKICTKLCIKSEINGTTHGDNLYLYF